eukprot:4107144-Pleurochrysis_carterae.AAC.1
MAWLPTRGRAELSCVPPPSLKNESTLDTRAICVLPAGSSERNVLTCLPRSCVCRYTLLTGSLPFADAARIQKGEWKQARASPHAVAYRTRDA